MTETRESEAYRQGWNDAVGKAKGGYCMKGVKVTVPGRPDYSDLSRSQLEARLQHAEEQAELERAHYIAEQNRKLWANG